MGDISNHFSRKELMCPCGCKGDGVDVDLVPLLEVVRKLNRDKPITPNSGYRCPKHNKKVGGSRRSKHMLGQAADLPVSNPKLVYNVLCKLYPDKYGFGLYKTFVHVDCGRPKRRWVG